jgi:hypothetical protein
MWRTSILTALVLGACGGGGSGDDGDDGGPDAAPDGGGACEPANVLPVNYRPIPEVSAGMVSATTMAGVTTAVVDGTAGGLVQAPDNPYIYLDLATGTKVAIDDIAALTSTAWDIAIKRASLRTNSGDSGPGLRELAIVPAATLGIVDTAPTAGYMTDDFTDDNCEFVNIPGGEPMSAFGEWYDYNDQTHVVTPSQEVYVLRRMDGSHTAFRIITYYGDQADPMRGAYYQMEWKEL